MDVLARTESKLLGRTELRVNFGEKAGSLSRVEAVKIVADELKVDPTTVGLISLLSQSGSRRLVGRFHVYSSKDVMATTQEKHLGVRLLSKEQREALKQAKKQAQQPKAK